MNAESGVIVMFRRSMMLVAAVCLLLLGAPAPPFGVSQPTGESESPLDQLRSRIRLLAGTAMFLEAEALGVTVVEGKSLGVASAPSGSAGGRFGDVGIGVDPVIHENEPTVAANPADKKKLVAGSHFIDEAAGTVRCVAYTSADGGLTWSAPFTMPQLRRRSFCSDPVLAYAPDGTRVYYAYMDIKFQVSPRFVTSDLDIVVSFSDDNGATWTGPIVALDGDESIFDINTGELLDPGFDYDKPWIATHVDRTQKDWVYVTATRFDSFDPFECHIAFAGSSARGASGSWSAPNLLDDSSGGCAAPVVVQGSRPSGGVGGEVLVAWYNSTSDGWLDGSFEIRTRRSPDHGATWDAIAVAAADSFEAPFWLGPEVFYHRWWGTMFPDVDIDSAGSAHVAYTHDPAANPFPGFSDTPEDGDIRYVSSGSPPYTAWSAPVTVNDDGLVRAQGYAALEVDQRARVITPHLMWEDHRLSPEVPTEFPNSSNLYYDMFHSQLGPGGWSANDRVSDASSISDFIFIGDYNDLTSNGLLVFGIWTDRRHQTDIFAFEDNVFGSLIP